ncbi:MAG: hypothetical protein NTU57_02315 [Candidatus Aenigmarchaeota archaeon]|nr:hypothetical protein [Candidatus Aenigmarchaeota archaeon]
MKRKRLPRNKWEVNFDNVGRLIDTRLRELERQRKKKFKFI